MQPLWKNVLTFLQKVKYRVSVWPRNPTSKYIAKGIKRYIHIIPLQNFCSHIIYGSQERKTIQVSTNWLNDKKKMWCIIKYSSAIKRNEDSWICSMDKPWKHDAKWKKLEPKDRIWFHLYKMPRIGKRTEAESILIVAGAGVMENR